MTASNGAGAVPTDAELIRASRRDPAAFSVLFERHAALMQRWLVAQTADGAVAHELLAETFAQAWRGRARFRGEDERSGGAWLYGIARNLLRQHRKRGRVESAGRRRLSMATDAVQWDGAEEIDERIDAQQLSSAVRDAFAELTPEQQQAIAYRVIGDLSYDEVAAQLQCTTATARTRVFRGLYALRASIVKGDPI
ncbi:MAG TPA: RNA polymerase sigma factor [Solirubrobacteraceae bacterium]|jgi:RNA polymerase sigma factor (sigma-70 family)|nr:RNA polymerase sigma factor [Solirubrobacteraceae bacterium]